MSTKVRDIILMLFKASDYRISGKTKIQKQCYFLSIKINEDMQFQPHYYGPFSPIVDDALNELIGIGFIEQTKIHWSINNMGFEKILYDYELTEGGKQIATILATNDTITYKKIDNFIKTLKELEDLNYMQLSVAAKAYFILKAEGKNMTFDEITKKSEQFNWHLSSKDIEKSVELLGKLKLATKTKA